MDECALTPALHTLGAIPVHDTPACPAPRPPLSPGMGGQRDRQHASEVLSDQHHRLMRMRLEGLDGIEIGPSLGRGSYGRVYKGVFIMNAWRQRCEKQCLLHTTYPVSSLLAKSSNRARCTWSPSSLAGDPAVFGGGGQGTPALTLQGAVAGRQMERRAHRCQGGGAHRGAAGRPHRHRGGRTRVAVGRLGVSPQRHSVLQGAALCSCQVPGVADTGAPQARCMQVLHAVGFQQIVQFEHILSALPSRGAGCRCQHCPGEAFQQSCMLSKATCCDCGRRSALWQSGGSRTPWMPTASRSRPKAAPTAATRAQPRVWCRRTRRWL
jgi:hypothetical protein